MYLKLRALYLLLLFSLVFVACSDSPGPVGYSLLNPADLANLKEMSSDSLSQSSSYFKNVYNNSASSRVLLGKYNSSEASFLTKFSISYLADSIQTFVKEDSIKIIKAIVEMIPVYNLGDSTSHFDFTVHKVNSTWSDYFDCDSLANLSYNSTNLASNKAINYDSLYSFELNTGLVKEWFSAVSDTNLGLTNHGIYLKPTSNTKRVVGFQAYSSTSSDVLRLKVVVEKKDDWVDTLSFISIDDIHVVKNTLPAQNPEFIYIQGGVRINSKVKFSMPSFPANTIINEAILTLTIDSTKCSVGKPRSNYLYVNVLTDSVSIAYDSTVCYSLTRDGDKFAGDISHYIQKWVDGEKNCGLLISFGNEAENIDMLSIYSSTASDKSKRPLLKIKYSVKK